MSTNTAVMPADKIGKGKKEKSNILVTVLLLLGCVMILFPLYMTIVIALKSAQSPEVVQFQQFP